jgi:DNA-binding transcriptional LysR family regulator
VARKRALRDVDLNLLTALDALLRERSVTRAAARLGVTQSAMSRTLGRLRALFDDPLLARRGDEMLPTALAAELAPEVRRALETIEGLLGARTAFVPETSDRRFVLLASDYAQAVVLPRLLDRLRIAAPSLQIVVRSVRDPESTLLEREAALMIGPARPGSEALRRRLLFTDRLVCAGRRGHPLLDGELTLARYLSARHVLVAPRGDPGSIVNESLRREGHARHVVLEVPHFLSAIALAAASDLLLAVPERVARAAAPSHGLALAPLPFATPPIEFVALWHARHQEDAAHAWLRGQIVAATLPESAPAPA